MILRCIRQIVQGKRKTPLSLREIDEQKRFESFNGV